MRNCNGPNIAREFGGVHADILLHSASLGFNLFFHRYIYISRTYLLRSTQTR
jgi:hypothetical protein